MWHKAAYVLGILNERCCPWAEFVMDVPLDVTPRSLLPNRRRANQVCRCLWRSFMSQNSSTNVGDFRRVGASGSWYDRWWIGNCLFLSMDPFYMLHAIMLGHADMCHNRLTVFLTSCGPSVPWLYSLIRSLNELLLESERCTFPRHLG